ncbi:MAG: hypothetical protein CMO81_07765 [Waddliaceae bacterium]|nr:hypothetical protein [Waddliaceae bacterium]|tara:strand:+ start:328 stop:1104 length:777 start_codon:yes stop_codon:yes gene_type:complete
MSLLTKLNQAQVPFSYCQAFVYEMHQIPLEEIEHCLCAVSKEDFAAANPVFMNTSPSQNLVHSIKTIQNFYREVELPFSVWMEGKEFDKKTNEKLKQIGLDLKNTITCKKVFLDKEIKIENLEIHEVETDEEFLSWLDFSAAYRKKPSKELPFFRNFLNHKLSKGVLTHFYTLDTNHKINATGTLFQNEKTAYIVNLSCKLGVIDSPMNQLARCLLQKVKEKGLNWSYLLISDRPEQDPDLITHGLSQELQSTIKIFN